MKIAFDAKRALNNGTGLGNYARNLLNALMRDYPNNAYLLFTPRANDKHYHQLPGDFKLHFPETKYQKAFSALWRSFGITADVVNNGVDVYHGLSNELPLNIHRSNIPAVVTVHDLIFLKHQQQYPFIDRQIYDYKTRYAVEHAQKIIAISNETRRDLMHFYNVPETKIEVIYQSVSPAFVANDVEPAPAGLPAKYILNVGSFYPRKNQKVIVEAFDLVKDKIEEDLLLVGNAGNRKSIEALIAQKGLQGRVKIADHITNAQLPAVYRNASAFVYPSLYEGFGIPVLEALFSKVPVIATRGGAIEEAAGKNSLLINPREPEEIAEQLLFVLQNDGARKRIIDAGYAHALTMTDTICAAKTMKIYESIM